MQRATETAIGSTANCNFKSTACTQNCGSYRQPQHVAASTTTHTVSSTSTESPTLYAHHLGGPATVLRIGAAILHPSLRLERAWVVRTVGDLVVGCADLGPTACREARLVEHGARLHYLVRQACHRRGRQNAFLLIQLEQLLDPGHEVQRVHGRVVRPVLVDANLQPPDLVAVVIRLRRREDARLAHTRVAVLLLEVRAAHLRARLLSVQVTDADLLALRDAPRGIHGLPLLLRAPIRARVRLATTVETADHEKQVGGVLVVVTLECVRAHDPLEGLLLAIDSVPVVQLKDQRLRNRRQLLLLELKLLAGYAPTDLALEATPLRIDKADHRVLNHDRLTLFDIPCGYHALALVRHLHDLEAIGAVQPPTART
mmetsp:Transcript_72746/g.236249  ORF Transcript_72746/g.236249 Transcript_72746/m.236249 type:complete len:372 (+) Transcript_72746:351-1466(+)